jgi:hypothetical protein
VQRLHDRDRKEHAGESPDEKVLGEIGVGLEALVAGESLGRENEPHRPILAVRNHDEGEPALENADGLAPAVAFSGCRQRPADERQNPPQEPRARIGKEE